MIVTHRDTTVELKTPADARSHPCAPISVRMPLTLPKSTRNPSNPRKLNVILRLPINESHNPLNYVYSLRNLFTHQNAIQSP